MRVSLALVGLVALLTPFAAAWSKEDREIFRIRDEIQAHEDPSLTFYDILGIPKSANQDDITRAYRKKTRELHPDKVKAQLSAQRAKEKKGSSKKGVHVNKGPSQSEIKKAVKLASDRQARLSLIVNILRGPERDRYDYFLANGFPLWKGTDYYYNRYRPGLGTVMTGLFLVGGGAIHYLALYMGWKRQREFVERYIRFARETAWGGSLGIPGIDAPAQPARAASTGNDNDDEDGPPAPTNRKQRRMMEKESKKDKDQVKRGKRKATVAADKDSETKTGPTGAKKRVVAENGKVLVVDSLGDVYLEEENEDGYVEELLLDPNELPCPTYKDTLVIRLPIWVYNSTVGRLLSSRRESVEPEELDATAPKDLDDSDVGQRTPSTDSAEDFELLDKSVDSIGKSKVSGSQAQGASKAAKRKGKKK